MKYFWREILYNNQNGFKPIDRSVSVRILITQQSVNPPNSGYYTVRIIMNGLFFNNTGTPASEFELVLNTI